MFLNSPSLKLTIILSLLFYSFQAQAQWQKVLERDSVTVYHKTGKQNLNSYRATAIINCQLDSLYNFFIRFEKYPTWINFCTEVKLLYQVPDSIYTYYSFFDFPWPASNREAVSKLTLTRRADTVFVSSTPSKQTIPKRFNTIRVTEFREQYMLVATSSNTTLLTMEGIYNPGGYIPGWLVKKMLTYGPYDVILNIKNIVER